MKKSSIILGFKLPPPLVTLLFAVASYALDQYLTLRLDVPFSAFIIFTLLMVAAILVLPAVIQFYQHKTTVNPLKPEKASVLVKTGLYRFSRNPMYLGMACSLVAWQVYLANPLNGFLLIAYILYMNQFQIKPEEEALVHIFGDEFRQYMLSVRRWL